MAAEGKWWRQLAQVWVAPVELKPGVPDANGQEGWLV
jgi:hypothetical protein